MLEDFMKKTATAFLSGIALIAAASPAFAANSYDPFARDIKILTNWFEGQFDNEEQVWYQNHPASNTTKKSRHTRIHTMHRRLEWPELGEHVFYVEEYKDNDPEDLIRQRIVTFKSDPENGAIRMKQGFFKDAPSAKGAYIEPAKLSSLTKADVFFMEDLDPTAECDVLWKRVAGQFEGKMKDKSCIFGEGEKRRYSVHDMSLSKDKYWRVDATYLLSDDSFHAGSPNGKPNQLRRAEPFICGGRFFPDANSTFDEGKGKVQAFKNIRTHSQGGSFQVKRDSDSQMFEVLLRTKEYPFYDERPDFLYFSLRKAGEERSLAFTVNDNLSRQMAVTIPGISVGCHREGYEFDETLVELP